MNCLCYNLWLQLMGYSPPLKDSPTPPPPKKNQKGSAPGKYITSKFFSPLNFRGFISCQTVEWKEQIIIGDWVLVQFDNTF